MGNRLGLFANTGLDIDSRTVITISPRQGSRVILEKQDVIRNSKPVHVVHSCDQWDTNGRHRQWREELVGGEEKKPENGGQKYNTKDTLFESTEQLGAMGQVELRSGKTSGYIHSEMGLFTVDSQGGIIPVVQVKRKMAFNNCDASAVPSIVGGELGVAFKLFNTALSGLKEVAQIEANRDQRMAQIEASRKK